MIGTKDIDTTIEAAVELVLVVGDVGREIGVATIGLDEYAVLVVAEVRGSEPYGIVFVVEVSPLAQCIERTREAGASVLVNGIRAALGVPHVEFETKTGE